MRTDSERYRQQLLLALRLRDVPGPRIAEALAEVDSHVAETGEDPREAFGRPQAYADQLCRAVGQHPRRGTWVTGWLSWGNIAIAVIAAVGGGFFASGLLALGAGDEGIRGLPALSCLALGLVLLGGLATWLAASARRNADRVVDPRTGADMVGPLPRWALASVALTPVALLLLGYLVSSAGR